jgi:predicted nucleotidyltransferase component of viral defense system
MKDTYKKQVALLIDILTEIAKEDNFALHGGTAINLFHLNMPRLSVDIDLTFVPFSNNRDTDLGKIRQSLENVKNNLKNRFPIIHFEDEKRAEEELKLLCTRENSTVKVEVNQINRGLIVDTCIKLLCTRAEEEFDKFCEVKTVSVGQLWGGKLNAAMERQHPRDIFDVKSMLNTFGFTDEIKQGFIFFLLCGKRPINEILNPHFTDQRVIFESQFSGMTNEEFTYTEFEKIRANLVEIIQNSLTDSDKEFLLSFVLGTPNWTYFDYSNYPAIKWELLNINNLKITNPIKHIESVRKLKQLFDNIEKHK